MHEAPTDWLDHSARAHPDTIALSGDGESLDYEELRDEAGSVAAALADAGVGIGDPVAIDLPAGVPHAVALHGSILAGAIVQSMPPAGRDGVDVAPERLISTRRGSSGPGPVGSRGPPSAAIRRCP